MNKKEFEQATRTEPVMSREMSRAADPDGWLVRSTQVDYWKKRAKRKARKVARRSRARNR